MVRRLIPALVALATATSLVGLQPASAQGVDPAEAVTVPAGDQSLRARGVIVKLTSDTVQRRRAVASAADRALPSGVEVTSTVPGLDDVSLVRFDETVAGEDAAEVADRLEARADVEWAVPNYLARAQGAPPVSTNDPYFPQQRNLWDTRIASPNGGYSVKAPALWQATQGSSSVVVAVLDTGSVPNHPDLKGRLVAGYDFVAGDEVCNDLGECQPSGTYVSAGDGNGIDPNPTDPGDWIDASNAGACGLGPDDYIDSSWHGAHVAGIVAATANNRYGIAGVAPGVRVQPVRVIGHCGASLWDIALGIVWASGANMGSVFGAAYAGVPTNRTPARIANLSLGADLASASDRDQLCEFFAEISGIARGRGTTLVAAAGNAARSADLAIPAACPGFVSVGASSATGHRAWYSNYGTSVDVTAAGGDSLVEPDASDTVWSTILAAPKQPNGAYTIAGYEGTSMATPAVAGGLALMASLGLTSPTSLEAAARSAVAPFPGYNAAYNGRTIRLPNGSTRASGNLNCTTSTCGRGLFDLSRVTAPRRPPAVTGRATSGSVLRASAYGLVGPSASGTLTWWRGSTRVSTTGAYRVRAADAGKRLTVRHTITSGPFAGIHRDTSVTVAKLGSRTAFSMPSKVKKSKRVTMKVKVSASLRPTGTIRVYDGKRRIAVKRIYSKNGGRVSIRLPKLKKGKHTIRVVYSGNSQLKASSRSKVVRSR